VPAPQGSHELAPSEDTVPSRQSAQEVWPVAPWYCPASQSSQVVAAPESEYLPALQGVQALAALCEYVPDRQSSQEDSPAVLFD
jgi:hypothetical protein